MRNKVTIMRDKSFDSKKENSENICNCEIQSFSYKKVALIRNNSQL